MDNQSIQNGLNAIAQTVLKTMEDSTCFFKVQVQEKVKQDDGTQETVLKELVGKKIDTKMVKDYIDILQALQKQTQDEESQGGIVLQHVLDEQALLALQKGHE